MKRVGVILSLFFFLSCHSNDNTLLPTNSVRNLELPNKWYEGKAEINVYELEQNRYQDVHPGELVMVFVTEDFLIDRQVKNDTYTNPNSTAVLKLNKIRRFTTGIYDYSVFSSVFTRTDNAKTLKVTSSSQDWCGQSWLQANREANRYAVETRSYFEKEGDDKTNIATALLEDELYHLIRLGIELPSGDVEIVPSTAFSLIKHVPFAPLPAKAKLEDYSGPLADGPAKIYSMEIPQLQRKKTIVFRDDEMREILAITETYPSAFDKKLRTSVAKRKSVKWVDYWNKNKAGDAVLRQDMGLGGW